MDESRFSLYRADGRQRLWRHVGEQFADVKSNQITFIVTSSQHMCLDE